MKKGKSVGPVDTASPRWSCRAGGERSKRGRIRISIYVQGRERVEKKRESVLAMSFPSPQVKSL